MVSAICPVTSRLNVSAWILTASGPRSARIWDAWAKRKSPVRMATELFHWELTDGWPRRTRASSMTSSWNSVARWVSSIATAAWMTRGSFGSPNCAASSTSMARNRLPPAAMRCRDASVSSSSSGCAVSASDSSILARPSSTSASRAESGKSTGTALINCSPRHRLARTPRTFEYARSVLCQPRGATPLDPPQARDGADRSIARPGGLRPPRGARLADKQLIRRMAGQAQDRFRHDAEHQGRDHADPDRGAGEHARHHHLGPVGDRVAEEHQHDHADVEERRDRAAQHAHDDQRGLAGGDRGLEDREFPGEAAGQRYAREGQQEQREDARDQRRPAAQARPPGQVPGLAAGVPHQGDHGERAYRGETVGGIGGAHV